MRWLLAHPGLQWAWLVRLRERITGMVAGAGHATFWALFVIYATPLGAGPLRFVAAAGGYPLPRFAAAIALGCLPYYAVVAWLGRAVAAAGVGLRGRRSSAPWPSPPWRGWRARRAERAT